MNAECVKNGQKEHLMIIIEEERYSSCFKKGVENEKRTDQCSSSKNTGR